MRLRVFTFDLCSPLITFGLIESNTNTNTNSLLFNNYRVLERHTGFQKLIEELLGHLAICICFSYSLLLSMIIHDTMYHLFRYAACYVVWFCNRIDKIKFLRPCSFEGKSFFPTVEEIFCQTTTLSISILSRYIR